MKNKEMINKLRDNAELAIAVYGYFHLANPKYDFNKDNTDTPKKQTKIARNDPCPCGSGKKYKDCCGKSGPKI